MRKLLINLLRKNNFECFVLSVWKIYKDKFFITPSVFIIDTQLCKYCSKFNVFYFLVERLLMEWNILSLKDLSQENEKKRPKEKIQDHQDIEKAKK